MERVERIPFLIRSFVSPDFSEAFSGTERKYGLNALFTSMGMVDDQTRPSPSLQQLTLADSTQVEGRRTILGRSR